MGAPSALSRRVSLADSDFWTAWAEAVGCYGDDRYGVEIRRFGRVTALLSHGAPVTFFNRVLGLGGADVGILDDVMAFYRERQTPMRIDTSAVRRASVLHRELTQRGMAVVGRQANLALVLTDRRADTNTDVEVVEASEDDGDRFAELYDRAYHGDSHPPLLARFRRDSIVARFGRPGWRFYVARVCGEAVGGAILFVSNGIATLSGGATLPEHRGRGGQRALLESRITDSIEAGCDLVLSRCVVDSASHRNLKRAGLRDVISKHIWQTELEPVSPALSRRRVSVITAA